MASQTANVAAEVACGAVVISAKNTTESPLRAYGPGSNLADNLLFAVNSAGEVTIAGGTGNGYMLSQLRGAVNGQERTVWNPALAIPEKEFEFTNLEVARIKAAIEAWGGYCAAADRRWLEPLMITIFVA